MDRNEIAKQLHRLGRSDHKHLAALERNRAERCELLCSVAQSPEAALSGDVVPTVIEPKDSKK
jgi:hypothetical protein